MEEIEYREDIVGQKICVGDIVAFNIPMYRGLTLGKIEAFTPKKARVYFKSGNEKALYILDCCNLIKVKEEHAMMWAIKKGI